MPRYITVATALLVSATFVGRAGSAQRPARSHLPDAARVRALAGCYHLTHGAYSTTSGMGPATPTTLFRLDTLAPRHGLPGDLVAERLAPVESLPASDPRSHWLQAPSWRLVGADSLEIVAWATAMEAEVFYGHAIGDTLRGVVRLTSDAVPVEQGTHRILWNAWPWARASAIRVDCP